MHSLLMALLLTSLSAMSQGNYAKAWQALNKNDRKEATRLLALIPENDADYTDAYITKLLLSDYDGKSNLVTDFESELYNRANNPYPYLYALWFEDYVLGDYGKKTLPHQLKIIDHIINDPKAPGTLVSAANYQKGMHYLYSHEFSKANNAYNEVGNIRNWQYVGPFENLSQAGFYKDYGPLQHPEPGAKFKSVTNADVSWFTPAAEIQDGWTPVIYQFNKRTAVVYAQNFVTSETDQAGLLSVGASGSVKVWVNDQLLISESRERVTEMDTYNVPVKLNKGTNRVLVQLGFSGLGYPNFSVRFTDQNFKALPGVSGSAVNAPYIKAGANALPALQTQFAEKFFADKIAAAPQNLLNYVMLTDVYLRNRKIIEARGTMDKALAIAPGNALLMLKEIGVLVKDDNNTKMQEELEKLKQTDPESLTVLELKIKEDFDNERFEDGAKTLDRRIELFGENETTNAYKILMLVHDKKYDELVKQAEKMYARNPDNPKMLEMMYNVKKEVYKDPKGALRVYDNFMKDNYSYDSYEDYADKLEAAGNNGKALDIRTDLASSFPYSPSGFSKLSAYYVTSKKYDKAEENIRKAIALSPYNEYYWEKLGDIMDAREKKSEAIVAYNQSLQYDPHQYDIINKLRKLNGKSEVNKLLDETDIDKAIAADDESKAKNIDYGYYYILNEKNVVMHPGGATEEYNTLLVKITNQKGVDEFKESSIGYNNNQNLLIEKAEIRKKNKAKIEGERSDNEVVFSNLEPGDVIVFKYRLQSYSYGRFAKDFWDQQFFGGQIYTNVARYNLYAPTDQKINYVFNNSDVKPTVSDLENFKKYSWSIIDAAPMKDERFMPRNVDVATVLHVSTLSDWSDISSWYSDVVNNKAEEDPEIIALNKELFPATTKGMTEFQKARKIYDYIEGNIRYSSVSFRQSAFVPQRPSATLVTRLGDCKDMSSLFVTLAHMQGINAQMVLVDTRDNGQKETLLPGIEFNHCIAKAVLDKKPYYIELTDNYLPFTSLPNNLNGASILEIPSKNMSEKAAIIYLNSPTRIKDAVKRVMVIKPVDGDLDVDVKVVKTGHLSSGVRDTYQDLNEEKRSEEMEKSIANGYKNNVKLSSVSFKDLKNLSDSVEYAYAYKVKNEVAEIGSLRTFKISYPDVVASLDNFSSDTRDYPVEYWRYEDTDDYNTLVTVIAPAGTSFIEVPATETLSFGDLKYSLQYKLLAPGKLQVTRTFHNSRQQQVDAKDYPAFKAFFEKIVKAEQKFIAYK